MSNAAAPHTYEVREDIKPGPLEGLSTKLVEQHWGLYKGYVANVNELNKLIRGSVDADGSLHEPKAAELQRRLGFEYNGMVLHEHYFESLRKGAADHPSEDLNDKLSDDFSGFKRWQRQFTEIGRMRGTGWAITALDPLSKRLTNFWITDHEVGHVAGYAPVIVMDVWEHAYVTDYGTSAEGRAEYIEAFFRNLDWDVLSARLDSALRAADAAKVLAGSARP